MRAIILSTLFILLTLGFSINEVAAKGFGGSGFSSYRAKSYSGFSGTKTASNSRPWQSSMRGAFGGFVLGTLISSLFMGHGFGSALFSWLIIGGLLMLCINALRRQRNMRDPRS